MTLPSQAGPDAGNALDAGEALVSYDDLHAILNEVWASYLHAGDELLPLAAPTPARQVAASVSVMGGFNGHVVMCASEAAAKLIAGSLLELAEGDVSQDDIADAMGEMANVVGGNLKSLLPGPSSLSLPIVITSDGGSGMRWPDASAALYADLSWRGEPVTLTIWTASRTNEPSTPEGQFT